MKPQMKKKIYVQRNSYKVAKVTKLKTKHKIEIANILGISFFIKTLTKTDTIKIDSIKKPKYPYLKIVI